MSPVPFQSTRPIRGATDIVRSLHLLTPISIHAPHTGRDVTLPLSGTATRRFQSTRPIRGATCNTVSPTCWAFWISIHAPHTGRDSKNA